MMANVVVAVLLAGAPHSMAEPAVSTDELVGLWKARRRFGPDGRGTLVIRRTGPAYTADMMGRILPVRVEQGELSFDLPGGQGTFRGRPHAGGILRLLDSFRSEGHGRARDAGTADPGWNEPMERPGGSVRRRLHLPSHGAETGRRVAGRPPAQFRARLGRPDRRGEARSGRNGREAHGQAAHGNHGARARYRCVRRGKRRDHPVFSGPWRDLRFHARRGRQRLLSARQEPGPLRLPAAPGARRCVAHGDSRRGGHRSPGHGEAHPGDRRHADGLRGHAADPRPSHRTAREAGAGGVLPRRAPGQAPRDALGGEEPDRDDRGRRHAGRGAAHAIGAGLPGP